MKAVANLLYMIWIQRNLLFHNVDDSIDEDTYEEYKYADCEDDFYYNAEKKTVSRNHLWEVKAYSIEK